MRSILFILATMLCAIGWAVETTPPPLVYVPYDKLPPTDPKNAGVLLPYEEFRRLWESSQRPAIDPTKPPIGAALTAFELSGTVVGESANLRLSGTVVALATGWSSITLPAGLAVAKLRGSDDRIMLERSPEGLRLHLPAAGTWTFTADVAAPVARDAAGGRSLDLVLPSAGSGRLELQLPEAGAELNLAPALAVAIQPTAGGTGTTVRAVVGEQPSVRLTWRAPVAAAAGEALVLCDSGSAITLGERTITIESNIHINVLRRAVADLSIKLPAECQVLAVEAPGLRTWDRVGDELRLHTHEAKEGVLPVHIKLERLLPVAAGASRLLEVTLPTVVGAERQTGVVVLKAAEGLAVTVQTHEGLSQVDPKDVGSEGAAAAFRFLAPPPPLAITVVRLEADVRTHMHQLVRLANDETRIDVVAEIGVRRAGVFILTAPLPVGWELVDAGGLAIDDSRTVGEGASRHIELSLRSRLIGDGRLVLRFRAPAALPRSGSAPRLDIGLLSIDGVRMARGTLAVAAPKSWALSAISADNLAGADARSVAADPLLADAVHGLRDDEEVALAWTWLGQARSPVLSAAPRSRELIVHQEEQVLVSEGGLRRLITWHGDVRYSATPSLHLHLPAGLAGTAQVKAAGLAERPVTTAADGSAIMELRFQTPLIGSFSVTLETNEKLPRLEAGKPATIHLPAVSLNDATRRTVLTAVARDGSVTITATAAGLDVLAPADLPPTLQGPGTVAAFRGTEAAAVNLTIERHDLVTLTDAAISLVSYHAVLGEDRRLRVAGGIMIESRGRPYLELRLPAGADLLEVAVDGRQTRPSRKADGALVVPLGERAAAVGAHRVAFAYEIALGEGVLGATASLAIEMPSVGGAGGGRPLPVERTVCALWVPDRLAVVAVGGDLRRDESGQDEQIVPLDGLTVSIPQVGRLITCSRLGDGGHIQLQLMSITMLHGLGWLTAVVIAVLGWWQRRRSSVAALIVVIALIIMAAALATASAWVALAWGAGGGAGVVVICAGLSAWHARRPIPTPVASPDPWMADKP